MRTVEAAALRYVQKQDFRVLHAGQRNCTVTGQLQGWTEFRRHDPADVYGTNEGESR